VNPLDRLATRVLRGGPPGEGRAARWVEADGRELTVVARGDALDLYHGHRSVCAFSVSPQVAWRLAWFLLRWSAVNGLRLVLWKWALGRRASGAL